jgi:hypothetical protein
MRWRVAIVVAFLCPASGRPLVAADPLIEAARRRQDATRSVVVEFEVKEFVGKGKLTGLGLKPRTPDPVPKEDTEIVSRNRLVIEGEKARFENNHPMFYVDGGELIRTSSVVVTDGETAKLYFPTGIGGRGQGQGIVWANAAPEGLRPPVLTPLTAHFRGLTPHVTPYPVDQLRPTSRTLRLDGRTCSEYEVATGPDKPISLFVDGQAEFALRRIRKLNRGHLYQQLDVAYGTRDGGLVPERWTIQEFDAAGKVKSKTEAVVLDVRVNPDVPRSEFDVEFPPGSSVYDQRTGKDYVVKEGGMMRETTPAGVELDAEVPVPGSSWLTRNRSGLLWGALIALAGLACAAAWWRKTRAADTQP